jgi:uncharacterized protein
VNYPHLVRLFEKLGVPTSESSMSFGASIRGGAIEYGLASMDTIFAQRRNALNPRFLRMLTDILHFNRNAEAVANDPAMTIGELLGRLGTGQLVPRPLHHALLGRDLVDADLAASSTSRPRPWSASSATMR